MNPKSKFDNIKEDMFSNLGQFRRLVEKAELPSTTQGKFVFLVL